MFTDTGIKRLGIRQKQRRWIENLPSSDVSLRSGSSISALYFMIFTVGRLRLDH